MLAGELAAASDDAVLHIVSAAKPVSHAAVAIAETATTGPGVARAEWEDSAAKDLEGVLKRAADSVAGTASRIETYARIGSPAEVLCEARRSGERRPHRGR